MTLAEGVANILLFGANIALVCVWYRCWRGYRVDTLRHRLFVLRDELFDHALGGELAFSDPAYVLLRRRINCMLRFTHKISFTQAMFMLAFMPSALSAEILRAHDQEWKDALGQLVSHDSQERISEIHEEVLMTVLRHVMMGAIPWMFVILQALIVQSLVQRIKVTLLRKVSIVEVQAAYAVS